MRGRPLSARAYLSATAAAGAAAFGLVWLWVALMPLAYLDPEYPAWLAKREMLARCDLGATLVVGARALPPTSCPS